MQSLLNYIGHKSKLLPQILPYFPAQVTGTFYDCFAGSAVVALSVPYARVVAQEINPHLSRLYGHLDDPAFLTHLTRLITQYGLTNSSVTPRSQYLKQPGIGTVQWMGQTIPNLHLDQLNKAGYAQLLADFNAKKFSGIDLSAAYMIATIYGRNSNVDTDLTTTQLSGAVGPLDFSLRCKQKLLEHQGIIAQGRHTFCTGSYDQLKPVPDDFCYFDPPYLVSGFRYGGWTEQDERNLLAWIDQLPCAWAMSNTLQSGQRVNKILETWAQGKTVIELDKRYRKWAGAGQDTVKRATKVNREVLILSGPPVQTFGHGLLQIQ
jgi:site-specific DNA-adenine methylase